MPLTAEEHAKERRCHGNAAVHITDHQPCSAPRQCGNVVFDNVALKMLKLSILIIFSFFFYFTRGQSASLFDYITPKDCDQNHFYDSNRLRCTICPNGTITSNDGFSCTCPEGTINGTQGCEPCPEGKGLHKTSKNNKMERRK